MKKGFSLERINSVNPDDQRGPIYNWEFPDGKSITILIRKRGSKFAGHFHKGKDPSKNPERFFIVKGKIKTRFINQNGEETETILESENILTIYPHVKHFMEALEDVILVELRTTYFDPNNPDTYPC